MANNECVIKGCSRKQQCRGLCWTHYNDKEIRSRYALPSRRGQGGKRGPKTMAEIHESFEQKDREDARLAVEKERLKKTISFDLADGIRAEALDRIDLLLSETERDISKLESVRARLKEARALLAG